MQIEPILSTGHLYSVKDVFPPELAEQIQAHNWSTGDYTRLAIGSNRRRQLITSIDAVDQYIHQVVTPAVESACGVVFTDPRQSAITWWLDEPGFRPRMHTDGDKPSALQVYWQPEQTDLGTAFYNSSDRLDLLHYFASRSNTGYIMLNTHEPRPPLWHDMQRPVPDAVQRVTLYISFGPYITI